MYQNIIVLHLQTEVLITIHMHLYTHKNYFIFLVYILSYLSGCVLPIVIQSLLQSKSSVNGLFDGVQMFINGLLTHSYLGHSKDKIRLSGL